jgi:SulP family sulfate permease
MHRVVEVTQVDNITDDFEEDPHDLNHINKKSIPKGVEVFEINGPFFFGAADKFRDMLREIQRKPKVLIIGLRHVPSIDSTGLRALEDIYENSYKDKTKLLIFGTSSKLKNMLGEMGFVKKIGEESFYGTIDEALEDARKII